MRKLLIGLVALALLASNQVATAQAVRQGEVAGRNGIIAYGRLADGTFVPLTINEDGELVVSGVSGGPGGETEIPDGNDEALGAKADSSCGSDAGTCSLIAIVKRLTASITTLNGKIDTLTTAVNGSVPAGINDIGQVTPTLTGITSGVTASMTGTTSTQLLPAAGSGKKNYLATLVCYNTDASDDTGVDILDGNGGSIIGSVPAAKLYGGAAVHFYPALPQPTANTRMDVVNKTTAAAVTCTGTGFTR